MPNISDKEGWGLTVIEAATQGTPTVGYDVPGLRDSVRNGRTGLLAETNVSELAKWLEIILTDRNLLSRTSKNALLWSMNFDWKKSTEQSWFLISKIYG